MSTPHSPNSLYSDRGSEAPDVHSSSLEYAARFHGAVGQWFLDVQSRIMESFLASSPAETALDVGGGHGQLAPLLTAKVPSVTVLGSTEACKEQLRPLIASSALRFAAGSLLALPFEDRGFDVVVSVRQLSHLEKWPVFLQELCRVSRRSVVIDYPVDEGLHRLAPKLFPIKRAIEKNTRPFLLFEEKDIVAQFAQHGFVLARSEGQFIVPMALHRALRSRRISEATELALSSLGFRRWASPRIALFQRK